jgi:hypothetical protein
MSAPGTLVNLPFTSSSCHGAPRRHGLVFVCIRGVASKTLVITGA